jgi:multidrug transporter EmrE-like cation transporter
MGNNSSGVPFYSSMAIIIISMIVYQVFQKNIAANIHPVVSVIISYAIALVFSVLLLFVFPLKEDFITEVQKANLASYLVGVAIIGIEIGFLLVYRHGWKIGTAVPFSSSITMVMLTFIGFFFFREHLTPVKIAGILLCMAGIFLLNR